MTKATDIRVVSVRLYFLPVQTRLPLKFGAETVTGVTVARACVTVENRQGQRAEGWGETPLSVTWVWPACGAEAPAGDQSANPPARRRPGQLPYELRHTALKEFCIELTHAWTNFDAWGHALEVGYDFQREMLPVLLARFNQHPKVKDTPMPWLAALVCCSLFDIAIHDAYGNVNRTPIYETYHDAFMSRDLAAFLEPAEKSSVSFSQKFPKEFLLASPPRRLRAWHLVGGLDVVDRAELTGHEPKDGHPVVLVDWIRRDGLKCLKIKLRGNDSSWDYDRIVRAGVIACSNDVEWLSTDFNCTVTDPEYVNAMLDRLRVEQPRIYGMVLYVEQPFPYELDRHPIDVHSVSARKPLFLDESAHDWQHVRLGRELGWNGVALKTCKTQTGAILSFCWAKAHGMGLMVQDLTNPMLAQIPHVLLAAHTGTIMGVETNAMQFYPEASRPEAAVHPGLYQRRNGELDLSSIRGHGFGYRLAEIKRDLPTPVATSG
jgi:L-alanine-DL-glutamate epimerase-like enolase superfamily enzyme